MYRIIFFVMVLTFSGCAGLPVQLEGITYMMPNGEVASCIQHPDNVDKMRCTYKDSNGNEIVIAIDKAAAKEI